MAVIAFDSASGALSITACTLGGNAMTSAGAAASNATTHSMAQAFVLVAPPTGTPTLSITISGTIQDIYYNLVVFSGVNQTTPVRAGTYQTKSSSGTNPSMTVTSNTNDRTVTVLDSGGPSISSTNQTSDGINTGGAFAGASDHCTTPAASVTHTWTMASSTGYAMIGFSLDGDPAGGGTTVPERAKLGVGL